MPEPFWHLICIHFCNGADYELNFRLFGKKCIKFGANLASKYVETSTSSGAIWDEFSYKH